MLEDFRSRSRSNSPMSNRSRQSNNVAPGVQNANETKFEIQNHQRNKIPPISIQSKGY